MNEAPSPRYHWSVSTAQSPRRDVDLFGPTTFRLDASLEPGGPAVPMLYLSAFVDRPEHFAERVRAALAWVDDTQGKPAAANDAQAYSLPDFVEDVDWSERLFIPEDIATTDWKGWGAAMLRRIRLATTTEQLHQLTTVNEAATRMAPGGVRAQIGRALACAHQDVAGQVAA